MDSPDGKEITPENIVPFSGGVGDGLSAGMGEISDESLRQLNELMEQGPGENASEEEVEAFMSKVLGTEAGSQMLQSFVGQLTEGGLLDQVIAEDEEAESEAPQYIPLQSSARMIFRVDLIGAQPPIWRRISLPADASFYDLHCAIQDSFGWADSHLHRFELREERRLDATFSSAPVEADGETDYCEIQNRIVDIAHTGWQTFHYVYDFGDDWEHLIKIEDVVTAGEKETSTELVPKVHAGKGLCPPEDCGGMIGFYELLSGESEFADEFPSEFLEKLREGKFHPPAVTFRNPAEALKNSFPVF